MLPTYRQKQDNIDRAVRSLRGAPCTNVASLAREFAVDVKILRARLKGQLSKLCNSNATTRLSLEQDIAMIVTLRRMESTGLHVRVPMLTSIANDLLRQAEPHTTPSLTVSHMWASR
jgi:hypothetical protein